MIKNSHATPMEQTYLNVRPLKPEDFDAWLPLWSGYNAFYGRSGSTALPEIVTATTWDRFFNPLEPVHALVAEMGEALVGIVHFHYHRSTTRIEPVCYLQDLYTEPSARRQGVARALIEAVQCSALAAGSRRVYWQTHVENRQARKLYDQMAQHHGFIVYALDTP